MHSSFVAYSQVAPMFIVSGSRVQWAVSSRLMRANLKWFRMATICKYIYIYIVRYMCIYI